MVYDSTRPFSFFCQSIFEILFTNLELAGNVDAFDDITYASHHLMKSPRYTSQLTVGGSRPDGAGLNEIMRRRDDE